MAPLKPIQKGAADRRVQPILDLAIATAATLKDRLPIATSTLSELESFARQPFPSSNAVALARKSADFDRHGSLVWNAATRMVREHQDDDDTAPRADLARLGVVLRAFAFLMLDAVHNTSSRRTKDTDQRIRIFRIGLKAAQSCLDSGDSELTMRILEACSKYVSAWEESTPVIRVAGGSPDGEEQIIKDLTSEFQLCRMTHASSSGRLDLAELFFAKASIEGKEVLDSLRLTAAERCYLIGWSHAHEKRTASSAMSWLERANRLLGGEGLPWLALENDELRKAIVRCFVGVSALQNDDDALSRAMTLLDGLEQEHGMCDRAEVLAMKVKVLLRRQPLELELLDCVVLRMCRYTVLIEKTYKIIWEAISSLATVSSRKALDRLETLVRTRLLQDLEAAMDKDEVRVWLERFTVKHTMICTTPIDLESSTTPERLCNLFDEIAQKASEPLSPGATHAMQALIWKTSNDSRGPEADAWLGLLPHPLFIVTGKTNRALIARRIILAALNRNDDDTARFYFYQLAPPAQDEVATRYVAFKLALKSNDKQLARECLNILVKHHDKDHRYLSACVLEAQQSGKRAIAVAAFQALVDQPPNGAQLPALLRCTAQILKQELEIVVEALEEDREIALGDDEDALDHLEQAVEALVRVFEAAAANIKAFRQNGEEQWRAEIQWWSKNAFNVSLELCAIDFEPGYLIRLLGTCVKFLECYPDDGGLMHSEELISRKQSCHFLCASAWIALGRKETYSKSEQMRDYQMAQIEVRAFFGTWQQPHHQSADAEVRRARALEMLRFNVETIFKLRQWEHLDEALTACLDFPGTARWETLADLVLIISDQTSCLNIDSSTIAKIPALLQKIINETWTNDKDIVKLARWLRCTFTIELGDANGGVSIRLVEQAASLARRGTEGRNDPYPEDELQWLATQAFDKALDLIIAKDSETANQWMGAALELARYAADNGSLHALLTKNRAEAERMSQRQCVLA